MRHLVSDTSLDELHEFAKSIGIKRCWFDPDRIHPHYDIPKKMVPQMANTSAVLVRPRELLERMLKPHVAKKRLTAFA